MTAMNRYQTTTQTRMMISTVEAGSEVRCFLRLRSQRDAAFPSGVTRCHMPRNRPRPRPTLTNSVVVPTWKNLKPAREGPTKIEAVFKPARDDGGLATVPIQVGGYSSALFGSIRTPSAPHSAQALSCCAAAFKFLNSSQFSKFENICSVFCGNI